MSRCQGQGRQDPRGRGRGQSSESWSEENLVSSSTTGHVPHQLGREASSRVRRGVDVNVLVLAADGDHFLGSGIADMPADDDKFWEVQRNLIDVGNRPSGL